MHKIITHLWFDGQAEQAVDFYCSVFKTAKKGKVLRFPDAGQEVHGREAGSVMTVELELNGQSFIALNGGPLFKFTEAVSFMIPCDTQDEIDYLWDKLGEGGDPEARQCGWLKDRFGVSWQITPAKMDEWMAEPARAARVMAAFMDMKKLDIAVLEKV